MVTTPIYRFGQFSLDTASHSLSKDGQFLPLQPKAYDVLVFLIENRTRLVARDELMRSVWGANVNVEEGALNYQIQKLRSVLGDDAFKPRYIRTIPTQGFQFVADVNETHDQTFIGVTNQNPNNQTQPVSRSNSEPFQGASSLNSLQSSDSRHRLYVVSASAIYAAYFGVALLAEIAYQFDRYGSKGAWIALLITCFVFASSIWGLSAGANRTFSGSRGGILLIGLVFVLAATVVLIGAWVFLPAEPITQANFQTFTAQAAYFKDFCYIVPLGLIYLVTPFHFIVAMQRELSAGDSTLATNLLTGKATATPRGTIFLKMWFLLLLLAGMMTYSLIARFHLFDNLKPGRYMNLFQSLIHLRIVLFFGLAILCVGWYHRALNDLKLEGLASARRQPTT